jgi:hypothetical protein
VFHFDLDDIIHLERLLDGAKSLLPAAASAAIGRQLRPEFHEEQLPPLEFGKQVALRRRLTWRLLDDATGISVEAVTTRYINPPAGAVDNTLEIRATPISRLEARARLTLLGFFPILGLLLGLLGWRMLQFDTAMEPLPWGISGILIGTLVALAVMPFYTTWLAGMLEKPRAACSPARVKQAAEAVRRLVAGLIEEERARADELTRNATAAAPPEPLPASLADYTNELVADPPAAILKYGLWRAENRRVIARAFADLQTDAAGLAAYRQARRPLSPPAAPAAQAPGQ